MRTHILGICGTFMGGVAALARALGDEVEGSDHNVYPPMSTQLQDLGIGLKQGYRGEHLDPAPDLVVIGNALSRGNPAVEHVLNAGIRYTSGAQWLAERVLQGRTVLAVAGTHGKTTTASLLAYILEVAGRDPGFLIGGVPANFGVSARLGGGDCFVVEADEYDTAFFDKRSKFVHYRPLVAVLNNLEYDHADIFPDLAAIQRQFHHFVRTVPGRGRLIVNAEDRHLADTLAMGRWTPVESFALEADARWRAELLAADGSAFIVFHDGERLGEVRWPLIGRHNVMNALAALAAAAAVDIDVATLLPALAEFRSVRRRMEALGDIGGAHLYDDFAHHPSAIAATLDGLRRRVADARILVALEPRSNSMRMGAHADALAPSLAQADGVFLLAPPALAWDTTPLLTALDDRGRVFTEVEGLVAALAATAMPGDHVVFMSNGGFGGAQHRLLVALRARQT
ncbi:MAG TPA: UDP-N-acetylmuramate:L-alanyl-gamma-D-glutamyl-meso-diaminopimelate ligase [Xanthomonadaceae bacterium]|nr:UDP-N-acetylmuramate:L-alanyl-gamma-D-glutamyl-meso-diaminopimelate ligase [Xanthomonadaceae bacterium]